VEAGAGVEDRALPGSRRAAGAVGGRIRSIRFSRSLRAAGAWRVRLFRAGRQLKLVAIGKRQ
jgi:hypothetical protein